MLILENSGGNLINDFDSAIENGYRVSFKYYNEGSGKYFTRWGYVFSRGVTRRGKTCYRVFQYDPNSDNPFYVSKSKHGWRTFDAAKIGDYKIQRRLKKLVIVDVLPEWISRLNKNGDAMFVTTNKIMDIDSFMGKPKQDEPDSKTKTVGRGRPKGRKNRSNLGAGNTFVPYSDREPSYVEPIEEPSDETPPIEEPKRRGRPRKVAPEPPVEEPPVEAPRRRGRPRKVVPEPSAETPIEEPRRRGRPRKVVPEPSDETPIEEPKRRGRPRKVVPEPSDETPPIEEPRRRGRPRKVTPEPPVEVPPVEEPKRRGRPRKITPDSSDNLNGEEKGKEDNNK